MTLLPALALAASCAAAQSAQGRLAELRNALTHGDWNDRMHAVQEGGPLGSDAEPLLRFAADDADWQVRLSAVHQLGRLGTPGLPGLEEVLRKEPCRHVRIAAVHWVGSMGEAGAPVLERALEDESRMLRMEDRYWLAKMGRHPASNPLETGAEQATASHEDLKLCAGSRMAGRLTGALKKEEGEAPPAQTAAAAQAASTAPADARDSPDYTQSLASARELADAPAPPSVLPRFEKPPPPLPPRPGKETLPDGEAGLSHHESEREGPRLEADAGSPKPENDPVPVLLEQLRSKEPRARARAADELGKRGEKALVAIPALRQALRDKTARVRACAALALGNLRAEEASADLIRAARDKDEDARWSAVVALGRLSSPKARAAFRTLTKTEMLGSR